MLECSCEAVLWLHYRPERKRMEGRALALQAPGGRRWPARANRRSASPIGVVHTAQAKLGDPSVHGAQRRPAEPSDGSRDHARAQRRSRWRNLASKCGRLVSPASEGPIWSGQPLLLQGNRVATSDVTAVTTDTAEKWTGCAESDGLLHEWLHASHAARITGCPLMPMDQRCSWNERTP